MSEHDSPFTGPQLQDSEFVRADMANTNFDGVNLSGAKFFAVMDKASFKNCRMPAAVFDDVNLGEANFHNTNFSGTTFDDVDMSNVEISNANIAGMKVEDILVTDLLAAYRSTQT